MYKRIWKDEEGVSPVIATILMVAITVVLAGVLVVYMQQFSKGPGTSIPNASSTASSFTNPVDGGKTSNGGGWTVQVASISSKDTLWGDVTVQITLNKLPYQKISNVKPSTTPGWFYYTNGTTGITKWYALAAPAQQMSYCPGSTATNPCAGTGAAASALKGDGTLVITDLQSVQRAVMVVVDTDGGGTVTAGDMVLVFASNDGNLGPEITGTGYKLEITLGGQTMCSSPLT